MSVRNWICLLTGWLFGGLSFILLRHTPYAPLSVLVAIGMTIISLWIVK